MNQRLDMYQGDIVQSGLNDAERLSMRESLMAYMERNPLKESISIPENHSGISHIKNKVLNVFRFF